MNIMSSKPIRIDTKYENVAIGKRYIDRKDLFNRKDGFIYINNVPLKYTIRLNRAFPIDIFNTIEWVHAEQMDAATVEKVYNELVIRHDELKENRVEEKKEEADSIIDEETEELINDVLDYAIEEDQIEESESSDEEEEDIDDDTEEELNPEHPHANDQQFTFSSKKKRHRR